LVKYQDLFKSLNALPVPLEKFVRVVQLRINVQLENSVEKASPVTVTQKIVQQVMNVRKEQENQFLVLLECIPLEAQQHAPNARQEITAKEQVIKNHASLVMLVQREPNSRENFLVRKGLIRIQLLSTQHIVLLAMSSPTASSPVKRHRLAAAKMDTTATALVAQLQHQKTSSACLDTTAKMASKFYAKLAFSARARA